MAITSPAKTTTLVVPSPICSSWARETSSIALAAGCATSSSRRMAFPSFVMTTLPIESRIILSMERGPIVVLITSATVLLALMLFIRAISLRSLSVPWLRT